MQKLSDSLQLEVVVSPSWPGAALARGVARRWRGAVDGVVTFCLVVFEAATGRYDR